MKRLMPCLLLLPLLTSCVQAGYYYEPEFYPPPPPPPSVEVHPHAGSPYYESEHHHPPTNISQQLKPGFIKVRLILMEIYMATLMVILEAVFNQMFVKVQEIGYLLNQAFLILCNLQLHQLAKSNQQPQCNLRRALTALTIT